MSSFPSLRSALRADLSAATASRTLMLLLVPVLVFFEWGTGNDLVNVVAIGRAYASGTGAAAVALATVTGFLVPLVMQTLTGTVAAHGFPTLQRSAAFLHTRVVAQRPNLAGISYDRLARTDRWVVSVALGTTAAVLLQQTSAGAVGVRANRRTIVESALYMAITTAAVSAVIAGSLEMARRHETLRPAVDPLVDVLVNPFVWIGLFLAVGIVRMLTGRTIEGVRS